MFTFRRLLLAVLPTVALTAGSVLAFGGGARDEAGKAKVPRPAQTIPIYPEEPANADDEGLLGVSAKPEKPVKGDGETVDDSVSAAGSTGTDDPSLDVSADPAPPASDPLADSGAAVRQAVTDTLATIGYTGAKVEVSGGGSVVDVGVRASQACDRDALTGSRLVQRIRSGLPEVERVRVSVRGSGQSLDSYRRARCAADRGESRDEGVSGGGDVVYSKRGSGPFKTPAFTIAGRTWTVTYRNDSDFFQAFVIKNGKFQPFVLNSSRRGTGTESFRGPGRFQLKINGAEGWSVSVRDRG